MLIAHMGISEIREDGIEGSFLFLVSTLSLEHNEGGWIFTFPPLGRHTSGLSSSSADGGVEGILSPSFLT